MKTAPGGARPYRSAQRAEQARRTRQRLVAAATATFLARGYAATTMRAVAAAAGVSIATVEQFGTKVQLLKAAIDVGIVGDDDEVPVLERAWAERALAASGAQEFLDIVAEVIAPAQSRSAGLVLAVFEGSATDSELAELAATMVAQRAATAGWIIDQLAGKAPLRRGLVRDDAVDTLWVLMDPAVFERLVRHRGWSIERYQQWFARSARCLLVEDSTMTVVSTRRRQR